MKHVECFDKSDSGYAVMTDNTKIPVAERRKTDFLKVYTR